MNTQDLTKTLLGQILKSRFGFEAFRSHQEEICRHVTEGRDALVVMPTGAGKSLCYQVPGLARGKTTLVISPLVALIEDQVQHLLRLGIKADRIHAGRGREESRATFRAFLEHELEFLFIAPERLAVPGFVERLVAHPPGLIAVDEAHCISHWGHDFRPDYRLVGERLRALTETPMIALTATATPLVQDDILAQLGLKRPRKFIHGFRRTNLAIQLMECNPSQRIEQIVEYLKSGPSGERLPAIIYAPTRKKSEEIAKSLGAKFKAAAYHAGMPSADRERVQTAFTEGKINLIVATVAFGMGIDKANIRSVIHAALPGSVESYYQEIGRAGRDGLPSQAVLLHSYADRKSHEFFMERDYPEIAILKGICKSIPKGACVAKDWLSDQHRTLEPEVFEKAIEKLWGLKALEMDPEENISAGKGEWTAAYEKQRAHRFRQLDLMQSYTEALECRMVTLVKHFGDPTDHGKKCAICDRCAPGAGDRKLGRLELFAATEILASLSGRDGQASGRLFETVSAAEAKINRSGFERVLSALVRAKLLNVSQEEFEKEGRKIAYRRINLTDLGAQIGGDDLREVSITGPEIADGRQTKSRSRAQPKAETQPPKMMFADSPLFARLKKWRLDEARKRGVPAFRVMTDRVLQGLCEHRPCDERTLLAVPGVGPKMVDQFGQAVLAQIEGGA